MSSPSESSIATKYHMALCCFRRFSTLAQADDLATVLMSRAEITEHYYVLMFAAGEYFVAVVPKVDADN